MVICSSGKRLIEKYKNYPAFEVCSILKDLMSSVRMYLKH